MYPKAKEIQVMDNYVLRIVFDNNVVKEYDCKNKFNQNGFESLKEKAFFKLVKIDTGGYGISWDDEIDISEHELWNDGKEVIACK